MFTLNCKGKLLLLEKPLVMGVMNLTSDSFYEGSRISTHAISQKAKQMISEGADILDLGAQSTRPGSERVNAMNELRKLLPAIEMIKSLYADVVLSIDTYHAPVAEACVTAGASIVNDISGGNMDAEMMDTVAGLGVPYICMHMKGVPQTMQNDTNYHDVVSEIVDYFIGKTEECKNAGIKDVIIDPGFGFGKSIEQNFLVLKQLGVFKILEKPLLCGLSRKATVYKSLGITPPEALNGTTVLNTVALLNGANILRVHDVKEAVETVKLLESVKMV